MGSNNANVCYVCVGVSITYHNGAEVPTSFVTNLDDARMRTAPELYRRIDAANRENQRKVHAELQRYEYPDNVITAAIAQRWCRYGVEWEVAKGESLFIRALDAQRQFGKTIFGSGLLLSERAAAERAAAERAAATQWQLSERERRMIAEMEAQNAP